MSEMMAEGAQANAASSPSEPVRAIRTMYPTISRSNPRLSATSLLSSMIRMRDTELPPPSPQGGLGKFSARCGRWPHEPYQGRDNARKGQDVVHTRSQLSRMLL